MNSPSSLGDITQRIATLQSRFGMASPKRTSLSSLLAYDQSFQTYLDTASQRATSNALSLAEPGSSDSLAASGLSSLLSAMGTGNGVDDASIAAVIRTLAGSGGTDTIAKVAAALSSDGTSANGSVAQATGVVGNVPPALAGLGGTNAGEALVSVAKQYLGVPYVWGGETPSGGFDCSGLVQYTYQQLGVDLPRLSKDQARVGVAVPSLAEARPGDLVAFGEPVDHIGIYAGDNKMVVAPRRGEVVRVQDITATPTAIRRVVPDTSVLGFAAPSSAVSSAAPTEPAPGSAAVATLSTPGSGVVETDAATGFVRVASPAVVTADSGSSALARLLAPVATERFSTLALPGNAVVSENDTAPATGTTQFPGTGAGAAPTTPTVTTLAADNASSPIVRAPAPTLQPVIVSPTPTTTTPTAATPTAGVGAVPSAATITVPNQMTYADMFNKASAQYGVPAQLLAAMAATESSFNPRAVSAAGAQGLMQLMPATAASLGVDPFDPAQAINGAARLMSQYLTRFNSTELALAAYNAGPGNVEKYSGIPPFAETQNYIARVLALASGSNGATQPTAGAWGPNTQTGVVGVGGSALKSWQQRGYLAPATPADITKVLGSNPGPVAVGVLRLLENATDVQLASPEFIKTVNDINRDALGQPTAPDVAKVKVPAAPAPATVAAPSAAPASLALTAPSGVNVLAPAGASAAPQTSAPGAAPVKTATPAVVKVTGEAEPEQVIADEPLLLAEVPVV